MKRFAISVLNYNSSNDTIALIKSLQNFSEIKLSDIWIIEGGSSNHDDIIILEDYLAQYQSINYIKSTINLGYAGGNNLALKEILELDYEYVIIINPDVIIEEKSFFDKLYQAGEEFDIFTPKILYGSQRDTIYSARGKLNPYVGLTTMVGKKERDDGQYNMLQSCDWVTGCAMIIKTSVLQNIGLLTEKYFLYFEEADYCVRATKVGYKIGYNGLTQCYHNVSSTVGWLSNMQIYYMIRNQRWFSMGYLPRYYVPIFRIWYITYWIGGYTFLYIKYVFFKNFFLKKPITGIQ